MRRITLAAVLPGLLLLASPASADVRLTISNGQVTLSAKDATVRQILAEWARVGQTTIVNAERVVGSPVTLELTGVSEEQALDVILRSVSGYLAAPRLDAVSNASRYDRILVLPTSTGTRASAAAPPAFQQPQFNPQRVDEDDDIDDAPVPGPAGAPNGVPMSPRGPIFNAFPPQGGPRTPQPQPQSQPQPQPQPTGQPAAVPAPAGVFATPALPPGVRMSPGVAVPGMIVPAPQPQPGAPGVIQEAP